MIWDKETEFALLIPGHDSYSYYVLNLDTDGSRRVLDIGDLNSTHYAFLYATTEEWEVVGLASERISPGDYYAYDGTGSPDPVNQIPYLRDFLNHLLHLRP